MRSVPVLLAVLLFFPAASAAAADDPAVDVVAIKGLLDGRAIEFITEAISGSRAQLVVIELDSPGAVSADIRDLVSLIADPPVPVAVWVGPAPATAQGGAAQLLAAAPIRAAAPGVKIGYLWPTLAGERDEPQSSVAASFPGVPAELLTDRVEVEAVIPGLVDIVVPSLGQLVTGVNGLTVAAGGTDRTLETAVALTDAAGNEVLQPRGQTRFNSPGLLTRTLRLALRPEAAFFFLVGGLALATFEFYAAGAGIMAAVAVFSLALSGYGLTTLPLRWWALVAVLGGVALYVADFQRNDLGRRSLLGTALLFVGGMWFTDASPQLSPVWWVVLLVVAATALFFGIGMTAVVRARYSTATIGREYLIGRRGEAASDLTPEGIITVDGARWRAHGPRTAAITAGDPIEVTGVRGVVLEVAPARE